MNKPFFDSHSHVVTKVRKGLAESLSGTDLIRQFDGLHPIEIRSAFIAANRLDLVEAVFGSISVNLPYLHEITREDNPILSFWPFTRATALKLAKLTAGFSSIGLLGAPTLFNLLKQERPRGDVFLFDRDDYLFRQETFPSFVKCDVAGGLPDMFNASFEVIIGDPPWYLDDYAAWLRTARRLVKEGGIVIFVLFPEGVRETARDERKAILSLASELFTECSVEENIVDYETPSFEQVQMVVNGIKPVNWRRAGLVTGRVGLRERMEASSTVRQSGEWTERRMGSGRIFIKADPAQTAGQFLETADATSRFLSSPSRRNPGRLRANVMSSRGHGLSCADPARLVEIIDNMKSPSDIEAIDGTMEGQSRNLLRELVFHV